MNTYQFSRWLSAVLLLCLAIILIVAESSVADEPKEQKPVPIQWRTDYNEARKEAEAKKRPLVILFVGSNSVITKYRVGRMVNHRKLAKHLNKKTVPLKMAGTFGSFLASALNVNQLPTTIIAMPDGKIVERLNGYNEPEKLLESLRKTTRKN